MNLRTETLHNVHHEGRRGKPLRVHLWLTRRRLTFCVEGWYGRDGGWYWVRSWSRSS